MKADFLLNNEGIQERHFSLGFKEFDNEGELTLCGIMDSGVKPHASIEANIIRECVVTGSHGTKVASAFCGKDFTSASRTKIAAFNAGEYAHTLYEAIQEAINFRTEDGKQLDMLIISKSHDGLTKEAQQILDRAEDNCITLVCSGGNSGEEWDRFPAAYRTTISVGGVGSQEQLLKWTTKNDHIDFAGHAENYVVADPNTYDEYYYADGTSFSNPEVGQLVSLVITDFKKRLNIDRVPPAFVKGVIAYHCRDIGEKGKDIDTGYGIPDFRGAEDVEVVVPIDKSYIKINGIAVDVDTPAQIINSRTMIPIRAVLEALGHTVKWDSVKREVTVK